jgi:hypothetical protein
MSWLNNLGSSTLNQAQQTVETLCKAAGFQVDQFLDNGGLINLVIRGTRKQGCYVEMTSMHNLPVIQIYSAAASLPQSGLPPASILIDILAKAHPDPFLKWTVYPSKKGDIILSCSSSNFLSFFQSRPDVFSFYVRTVSVLADDVEKMTMQDVF